MGPHSLPKPPQYSFPSLFGMQQSFKVQLAAQPSASSSLPSISRVFSKMITGRRKMVEIIAVVIFVAVVIGFTLMLRVGVDVEKYNDSLFKPQNASNCDCAKPNNILRPNASASLGTTLSTRRHPYKSALAAAARPGPSSVDNEPYRKYLMVWDLWERLVNFRSGLMTLLEIGKEVNYKLVEPFVFESKIFESMKSPDDFLKRNITVQPLHMYFDAEKIKEFGAFIRYTEYMEEEAVFVKKDQWKLMVLIDAIIVFKWGESRLAKFKKSLATSTPPSSSPKKFSSRNLLARTLSDLEADSSPQKSRQKTSADPDEPVQGDSAAKTSDEPAEASGDDEDGDETPTDEEDDADVGDDDGFDKPDMTPNPDSPGASEKEADPGPAATAAAVAAADFTPPPPRPMKNRPIVSSQTYDTPMGPQPVYYWCPNMTRTTYTRKIHGWTQVSSHILAYNTLCVSGDWITIHPTDKNWFDQVYDFVAQSSIPAKNELLADVFGENQKPATDSVGVHDEGGPVDYYDHAVTLAFKNFRKHGFGNFRFTSLGRSRGKKLSLMRPSADRFLVLGKYAKVVGDQVYDKQIKRPYIAVHIRVGKVMAVTQGGKNKDVFPHWLDKCMSKLIETAKQVAKEQKIDTFFIASDLYNDGFRGGETPGNKANREAITNARLRLVREFNDPIVFQPALYNIQGDRMGIASILDTEMCVRAQHFVTVQDSIGKLARYYRSLEGKSTTMFRCDEYRNKPLSA